MNGVHLVVVSGADAGREIPLGAAPVLIGRDPECDLPLHDSYASRQHCWIEQRGGEWWVRDLGSKNGTWVQAEPVVIEHPLHDGDVLRVGRTQIRVALTGVPPTPAVIPDAPPSRHRLHLDEQAQVVFLDDQPLDPPLSSPQWALLHLLWQRRGAVVSRDEITRAVWPEADRTIFDYQIDKLVARVRARLGTAGDELIETVWGTGYRLIG